MTDEKAYLGWPQFDAGVTALAEGIDHYNNPDVIVGIARGGLPGAVKLSHLLDAPLNIAKATHYDGEEQQDEVEIRDLGLTGVEEGDEAILFDDIVDSGKTMETVVEEWESNGVIDFDFSTAALHVKPGRSYEPEYWVEKTDDWVVYPWEGSL